jgi:hypothetical protein
MLIDNAGSFPYSTGVYKNNPLTEVPNGLMMVLAPASKKWRAMPDLDKLPDTINKIFNILDLLVVRLALLALAAIGAYTLLKGQPKP